MEILGCEGGFSTDVPSGLSKLFIHPVESGDGSTTAAAVQVFPWLVEVVDTTRCAPWPSCAEFTVRTHDHLPVRWSTTICGWS